MKKTVILFMLSVLLVGCGKTASNVPETHIPTQTSAVEVPPQTVPEQQTEPVEQTEPESVEEPEPEPTEPCIFPADYYFCGHMQYAFAIELENDGDSTLTMTSLSVTDYRDGEECAFREVTEQELRNAMQGREPERYVLPYVHSVQFIVEEPENVDFDQRILTAVLQDSEGNEVTQSIRYTMHEEEAAFAGAPDGEDWSTPAAVYENYNSIMFPCLLSNDTEETLTLKASYCVMYVNGVPLRHISAANLYDYRFHEVKTLAPGSEGSYTDGMGSLNLFWNHRKEVFVYENPNGEIIMKEFRFYVPQDGE